MIKNTERSPLFLMANLGSEVSKIISAKEKGDYEILKIAKEKAKSIIAKLKILPETKENMEINILNDVILDLCGNYQKYQISNQNIKSYFNPFIIRLMQV